MDKNRNINTLTGLKERFLNNVLFSNTVVTVLSLLSILIILAYYCKSSPWLTIFNNIEPDTKQLIANTLDFQWVPVFFSRFIYVFYALILNFIAMLMGSRILRWLKVDLDSNINKIVFSIPLGWGIYSIALFCLGISGLLYQEAVYCFLTFLGILSILEIERFFREWKALTTKSRFKIEKSDLVFLPLIFIFIAIQFITTLSPVWTIDAKFYHMALPKLYAEQHALVHVPGFFHSTFPAHTDMLYLLGIITAGDTLSKLLALSISLMFLVSIFSIGNRHLSKEAGYLAVVIMILFVSPFTFFSQYFSAPWTDVALGLFSLLGVYAFYLWIEEKKDGYLYLSVVNCAFAAATKIHGVFFVLLFFAGFLVTVKMNRRFSKKLALCVLVVVIISLPWYIRSWVLAGDPIFPFLYKYLGAKHWSEYSNSCFWELHPVHR